VATLEADEFPQRGTPGDAVNREADVALELGQGPRGPIAEDPVDPAGIETQGAQPLLEFNYIVTPQHRRAPIQESVTEMKTRFHQGVPRLGAADAVDPQSPQVLEGLDGRPRPVAVDPVGVDRSATEDGGQPALDVGDGSSLVAEGERQTYRYAAISCSN
jgi:hypothetical protein